MAPVSSYPFLGHWWRKTGLAAILLSAALAIASVPTQILHDTVVHGLRLSGREVPNRIDVSSSLPICIVFWILWSISLFTALAMALIDIRHIRRQFAIEKQALLKEGLGDDLANSVLREKT